MFTLEHLIVKTINFLTLSLDCFVCEISVVLCRNCDFAHTRFSFTKNLDMFCSYSDEQCNAVSQLRCLIIRDFIFGED